MRGDPGPERCSAKQQFPGPTFAGHPTWMHSHEEALRLVKAPPPVTIFKEVGYGTAVGVESSLKKKKKKAEVQVQKVVD